MPNDLAGRFRDRAKDCRTLAKGLQRRADASLLEDIAAELDAAAKRIDALGVPKILRAQRAKIAANRNVPFESDPRSNR